MPYILAALSLLAMSAEITGPDHLLAVWLASWSVIFTLSLLTILKE